MADEVLKMLIKRVPVSKTASLKGFTRHGVVGQVYPAIVRSGSPAAAVTGKVMTSPEKALNSFLL